MVKKDIRGKGPQFTGCILYYEPCNVSLAISAILSHLCDCQCGTHVPCASF
jgi:hypothetical protein